MLVTRSGMNAGRLGLVLLAGALALAASSSGDSSKADSTSTSTGAEKASKGSSAPPLRDSAARQHMLAGAAVAVGPLREDAQYRTTLAHEYNAVTPENAMKWDTIHPEPDRYDFAPADSIVRFARDHDMSVRGHTLVWYRQVPSWVTDRSWTRAELEQVLHDHIRTVVGHYRGKVAQWDVVNEAVDDQGKLRDTVWMRVIGPDYIDLAFRWAHETDPAAKLFYNDYDIEFPGAKADAVKALVHGLVKRGVPIDGVGIQAHELTVRPPSRTNLEDALRTFTDDGLETAITENDVGIFLPSNPDKLGEQAKIYGQVLDACLAVPRCRTFVTWGFTDKYSWIPGELPGFGDALPYDKDYEPKRALLTLRGRLAKGRG
jgi:endo-1,4-beta-xylanase